jgi:GntR family transcriptional regulator
MANETEARLLAIPAGSPILLLRLLSLDAKGRPVEYMASVNHPRLVAFKTPNAEATW